jgi:hypothetical protein
MSSESMSNPAPLENPTGPEPIEPASAGPRMPKQRRNRWLDVALGAAAVVAVAGIAFAAGRLTAPTGRVADFGNGNFGNGNFPGASPAPGQTPGSGFGGGFGGALSLQGSIIEVTADHVTLKLASGQTVQVPLDGSTAYHREAAAIASDLQTGAQVLIRFQASTAGGGGIRTGQLPAASDITVISP